MRRQVESEGEDMMDVDNLADRALGKRPAAAHLRRIQDLGQLSTTAGPSNSARPLEEEHLGFSARDITEDANFSFFSADANSRSSGSVFAKPQPDTYARATGFIKQS